MAMEVKVPSVGESITSGTIAKWHVSDGGYVKSGEVLFTLETDKISTEIEAEDSGSVEILSEEGTEVPIGEVVARIEPGEVPEGAEAPAAPAAKDEVTEKAALGLGEKIERVSRAAEKAAAAMKKPSGAGAAALKAPAPKAVPMPSKPTAAKKAKAPPVIDDDRVTRTRMSPLRRKIATHLVAAQHEAAILTTFNECDMGAMMTVRRQVQEAFTAKHGVKLGFMPFFIKAVVRALKAVPQVNVRVEGDELVTQHYYDVGVAVGTEKGLVVPVIRDCDAKSLAEIEHDIAEYAGRARAGKLQLEDLHGGVFTISNGGIYGSMLSTPILNPPQSGILGMHTIQERPMAVDGKVVIRPMMYLALSYDHRVVDGKEAVTFLRQVKELMEEPARLFL